ncbi:hypothetical protein GQX73_g8411 [Xylaria multiplex]|uniref:Uncharacterized protein n=1 Tax=Xylaria multiplex TaxID=323545 RepID=A0A7C8MI18_9PEZI|nr:hypothetical protein GQX73_g8411 [Xylaria multiplex]
MNQNELKLVSEEGKDTNIDIVFLPQFGAQGLLGWTAKGQDGGSVAWPRDFLNTDIPNARILAYQYKAANNGNYKQDAIDLCKQLKERRGRDIARPIVLVAHSLGGILAAQVMVGEDSIISKHVQGLAFFGTPFQGNKTPGLSQEDILQSILKPKDSSDGYFTNEIQTLKQLSEMLSTSRNRIKLASFSEKPDEGEALVDEDAAKIPELVHKVTAIDGNHDQICKFGSRDSSYRKVLEELQQLAKVEAADRAHIGMNNYGEVGNYTNGNVVGGMHNNNTGSINYGESHHYDKKRFFEYHTPFLCQTERLQKHHAQDFVASTCYNDTGRRQRDPSEETYAAVITRESAVGDDSCRPAMPIPDIPTCTYPAVSRIDVKKWVCDDPYREVNGILRDVVPSITFDAVRHLMKVHFQQEFEDHDSDTQRYIDALLPFAVDVWVYEIDIPVEPHESAKSETQAWLESESDEEENFDDMFYVPELDCQIELVLTYVSVLFIATN